MTYWLLREDVLRAIVHARRTCIATAAQLSEFAAMFSPSAEGLPRNLKIAGDVAEIRVEGVLTKKPDFWSWYFGGGNTTYEQIQQSLAICAADQAVKRVRFYVDSPGGTVEGLFDALAAIDAFPKPKSVTAAFACSAAYAVAALGGKIEATNAAVQVGSVGVAVQYVEYDGIDVIDITSTEAPNKRPDPTTDEGKAVIRETLDAIHDLFADAIARGRGISKADVNENFGRGAVLLAGDAKKRGMIDRIAKAALRAVEPSSTPEENDPTDPTARAEGGAHPQQRKKTMNEEELRAQHPALYEAIVAKGEAQGIAKERKRVNAHLKLGDSSGATKVARDAIASGASVLDEDIHAEYLSAGMKKNASVSRQSESETAGAAVDGAAAPAVSKDLGDLVADALDAQRGKKS